MKKTTGILMITGLIGINLWLWPTLWNEIAANEAATAETGDTGAAALHSTSEESESTVTQDFRLQFHEEHLQLQWKDGEIALRMNPDQVTEQIGAPEETEIYEDFVPLTGEEETRAIRHIYENMSVYYLSQTGDAHTITVTADEEILEEAWWEEILPSEKEMKNSRIEINDFQELFIRVEESGMLTFAITQKTE
ncbi:hypothetical protein [Alkalicoccus daliensis]|uniref:Uncharacterized protein n=1 Tax=Alkalicoccus daliensis TaxID=745820 RepID=A0A1H0IZH8_9BACI|nr:hypothetical protein [Alkalicoccus daliensis]SDO36589.1 hypothetical protein SAMN04488053_1124 [Alkalicoccus daliensis]